MNRKAIFFIFLSVLAGLNLGSIRRSEDPIRDTQTNPILYEQKKEEEKDGKKGPLMYNVKNNPRAGFFTDSPIEKEKESSSQELATDEMPSAADTAGWWEEQPTASQPVPLAETVSEPPREPLPEAEKVQEPEVADQNVAAPEGENAPSGKGEDYWW